EPTLDYVVSKIPRWPFDKFETANRSLGTQMKATGEVMAIGRSIEESLLKAVRSLELGVTHIELDAVKNLSKEEMTKRLKKADDERLFIVAEAIRQGWSLEEIYEQSQIDLFFLHKVKNIVDFEEVLSQHIKDISILQQAKRKGFSDEYIAKVWGMKEKEVYELRQKEQVTPVYKMVDTCGAEFESSTPYYYGTYEEENESIVTEKEKILVLGSGPIRIGQGVEFDYATVHADWAIQQAGYEAIIVNNNPETVS